MTDAHDELANLVSRVSYKPGWRFAVTGGAFGSTRLALEYSAPDSDDLTRVETIRRQREFSAEYLFWASRGGWLRRLVEDLVRDAEVHELREFLRVDGERVLDPHPRSPGRDR